MKVIYIFILLLLPFLAKSQDISFSQFDLNLMYTNPAFAGFEQSTRILSIYRNQWNGLTENFNSNYVEMSYSLSDLNKNRISLGELSAAGGIFLIQDRENTVFKSYSIGITPITLHTQLSRKFYLSAGFSNTITINSLDWNNLIFSDQINDYNNEITSSNAQLPLNFNQTTYVDPSIGLILTRNSNKKIKSNKMYFIGFSWHHFATSNKSFYNNQNNLSKINQKFVLHGQYISSFNTLATSSFKFWKLSYKHTKQGNNVIQNDDLGISIVVENTLQLELGCFVRLARQNLDNNSRVMSESFIPLIRMRMQIGRNIGMELSYSYDYTLSRLGNINTFSTNEVSLNIYHFRSKRRSICPMQGDNKTNRKWGSILNNKNGYQTKNNKRRAIW